MSKHLKFDAANGTMLIHSKFGEYTEELLQLNEKTQVEFRKTTLHALKITTKELTSLNDQKIQLSKLLKEDKISLDDYNKEIKDIDEDIILTETLIQNLRMV